MNACLACGATEPDAHAEGCPHNPVPTFALEIRRSADSDQRWYLVLVGANGEDVLVGETLHNLADAERTARRIARGSITLVR